MTVPRKTAAPPRTRRQAGTPLTPDPDPEPVDKDPVEMNGGYDLWFPEVWARPPEYVIVVADFRDGPPGRPLSLDEVLRAGRTRTSDPEPDLEAEP